MNARLPRFLEGITAVLAAADAGGPHAHGVTALTRLVDVAAEALGTGPVTYAEVVGGHARVIAASRTGRFLLGRHTETTGLDNAGDDVREEDAQPPLAGHTRVAYVPVLVHGRAVGRIEVHGGVRDEDLPLVRLTAATAAHLAADHEAVRPTAGTGDAELFIAAAGHELRTPATVIKGYADTLRHRWSRLDDAARLEAVDVIARRADGLAALADRLLAGAGAGAGTGLGGRCAPFDLAEEARTVVAALPGDVAGRVALDAKEDVRAHGDASSVPVVLGELITNAVRYSPKDSPIGVQVFTESGTACLRVSDRGPGFGPGEARMAFERFWQAERGEDQRYGGVGLGLYLVRQIVERQHGWVSLRPRQGGGTAVDVRLPLQAR